jgi:hypothetical protein
MKADLAGLQGLARAGDEVIEIEGPPPNVLKAAHVVLVAIRGNMARGQLLYKHPAPTNAPPPTPAALPMAPPGPRPPPGPPPPGKSRQLYGHWSFKLGAVLDGLDFGVGFSS